MTAGRGRETREAVGERRRLLAAAFDLVLEQGYARATASAVGERAGLDATALEREFGDVQACVVTIYDEINIRFARRVDAAYAAGGSWRDSLRAAAYAAADFFAAHPREVRFCTVAILDAGEMIAVSRDANVRHFVEMIDAGRAELPDPDAVGPGAAEAAVGAIFERLLRNASRGEGAGEARDFVPELMYLAVRPYLGHAEAVKELSIPAPPPPGAAKR